MCGEYPLVYFSLRMHSMNKLSTKEVEIHVISYKTNVYSKVAILIRDASSELSLRAFADSIILFYSYGEWYSFFEINSESP